MNDENRKVILALRFTWRRKGYEISMNKIQRRPFDEALLPKQKARVIPFTTALAVNVLILLTVLAFPIFFPETFQKTTNYLVTKVVPHVASAWKPRPVKVRKGSVAPPKPLLAEESTIPVPTLPSPVAVAPVPKTRKPNLNVSGDDAPAIQPDQVVPAKLPLGSSAVPDLKKPRAEVQTGGFGDPDGARDSGKTNRTPNIAEFGMYDLPSGSGVGNGTGGRKGVSGVVSSAGFGNGVATDRRAVKNGGVQQGLFADGRQTTSGPKPKQVAESPRSTPVEILFKPKPSYTDSARAKKIEGEVLVEVDFLATGEVQVLQVTKGLGEGLDEAAEAAARQIRFKPATEDGQPVDSTAVVHIVFQLAY
jgi:TonB family protein